MNTKLYNTLAALLASPQRPTNDHDWESLIRLASAESILPALDDRVQHLALPSEIADYFAAVTELNRERNAAILSQLRDMTAALNEAGIEPVVLKGLAYLLSGTYSDPGARYLSDIDLLVPSNQLTAALQVLQTCGYQPDEKDPIANFRHHLPTLFRPGSLPVELHRSVGLGVCQKLLPAAELIQHSSLRIWNGVRLRIPSPDHLITHLVIHSQLLHPYVERIWPPLRALYDLALLERRFASSINWRAIGGRFQSQRQDATLGLHLLQARQTLGTPLPSPFPLYWSIRLRSKRRQLLRRFPNLRFVDPIFLIASAVSRRSRVVIHMLLSGGCRQLFRRILQPNLYRCLISETKSL